MAVRSVTDLPDVVPPRKKVYVLPDVRFCGLSQEWNRDVNMFIEITVLFKFFDLKTFVTYNYNLFNILSFFLKML